MVMQKWDVYHEGRWIDSVFFDSSCDKDYIVRSLIEHDGLDPAITIRRDNR